MTKIGKKRGGYQGKIRPPPKGVGFGLQGASLARLASLAKEKVQALKVMQVLQGVQTKTLQGFQQSYKLFEQVLRVLLCKVCNVALARSGPCILQVLTSQAFSNLQTL